MGTIYHDCPKCLRTVWQQQTDGRTYHTMDAQCSCDEQDDDDDDYDD
jgi:hypothetical protein